MADPCLLTFFLIELREILCELFIAIFLTRRDLGVAWSDLLVFPRSGELLYWEGVFDAKLRYLKFARLFLRINLSSGS